MLPYKTVQLYYYCSIYASYSIKKIKFVNKFN